MPRTSRIKSVPRSTTTSKSYLVTHFH